MDDGTEVESGPGTVAIVPPGHNTWVVGDEEAVIIDFAGVKEYVKDRWNSPNFELVSIKLVRYGTCS